MRRVIVSKQVTEQVTDKLSDLTSYLKNELKLSQEAAYVYNSRLLVFINSLGNPADYALCRFKRWRALGYRCAVFEKSWIFAYEIVNEGVIVRDMAHATMLAE
jgi:hypothetical protein